MKQLVLIDDLMKEVETLPKENFLYEGIKENSLNLVVAPSKIGKTTMAENLAMCIAAGHPSYLGKPVWAPKNQKVLVISLEEYFIGRTDRNRQQLEYMDRLIGNTNWHNNFFVASKDIYRYLDTERKWKLLEDEIKTVNPSFVVIDSLSRMHGNDSIEDSKISYEVMRRLRSLQERTGITLLVIHHTTKLGNEPLTLFNMAGSRLLAQEADAIIGMNKTPSGQRYIKPLAYRYADDHVEEVLLFKRNSYQWLEEAGWMPEHKILKEYDNRTSNSNPEIILNYCDEITMGDPSIVVETKDFIRDIVEPGIMSGPTLHSSLRKLIEDKKLVKHDKGIFTLFKD